MGELLDLTFYNPAQLPDEDFLSGFVARRELLEKILDRLGRIKARGLAQHRLIVGQRGMGKTTLLRRVALGVRDDPSLSAVLLPLSFREEQYNVHNLHVFWCNCLDALGDRFEASGQTDKARRIDADIGLLDSGDDHGTEARELFESWMKRERRRPLLLLDNLDIVLAGLKSEQWGLRQALQRPAGIVVIGASATALEAAATQEEAFYDFFQVDVLTRLEHHEVLLCLRHLARERGERGRSVLEVLDRDPARIHVLSDLTGGNPRTLVMLYLVLEASEDDDVMRDLERLLDQATPLYKARVEAFAAQARVVFDAVALAWNPVTAAEVASTTGLEVGTVSTQLDRLSKDGVLEKVSLSSTRRTGFQVAERFFDIWYLMRHGPRRQRTRLRWLTEMLRRIYTPGELHDRAASLLGRAGGAATGMTYCLALADAIDDRELRSALRAYAGPREEDDLHLGAGERAIFHEAEVTHASASWGAESLIRVDEAAVEATYRKALDESPNDPGLWHTLGRLLLRSPMPRAPEAQVAFEKASELEPGGARHWEGIGIALAVQGGHDSEAETAYRRAIDCDDRYLPAWRNLGWLLQRSPERCEDAEAAFHRAVDINPVDADAWADLGWLLARLPERLSDAEDAFRKAIELDPGSGWAWAGLGGLLTRSPERHSGAEDALRKAIEIAPRYGGAWAELGGLLARSPERHADAEDALRRAIELDPLSYWAWTKLGGLLARSPEHHAEAETALRKAIEIAPTAPWTWTQLGRLLAGSPQREAEAEAAFRKATEIDPTDAWAWTQLGRLLAGSPQREAEAEVAFRKAIEGNPLDLLSWFELGLLLAASPGRRADAANVFRKILEIDPSDAWTWNQLGELLTALPVEPAEAEAAFRKAVELASNDAVWWNSLGNYLFDFSSRAADAEEAFLEALRLEPENTYAATNLAYLLMGQPARRAEGESVYRAAVSALPPHGAGLLRAFHALSEENFGAATTELQAVLEEGHPALLTDFRDDLFRIFRLAEARGYGGRLLEWLTTTGLRDRYWPLWAAFDAYLHGEERLSDVNPEVRSGAEILLAELKPRTSATEASATPRRPGARPGKRGAPTKRAS